MSYNPFADPKILTALVDAGLSLLLYFVGKYAGASVFDDVKIVITTLQPIAVLLIAAIWHAENLLANRGILPKYLLPKG